MGRILGIDVGARRVGIAMSDPDGILATGVSVVDVKKKNAIDEIAKLATENNVELTVVGLPLNADGTEGPSAERVREFGKALIRRTGLRVTYHDERYTTVAAEETLAEAGLSWREKKGLVDKLAAQIILQGYLDAATGP